MFTQQLILDLNEVYTTIVRQNLKDGIMMSRREICEKIATMPAPRLYISPEHARLLTYSYNRISSKGNNREYRAAAKHAEFYRRYNSLPANARSLQNIMALLQEPAPSFYLSPERINRLLYKIYDRRKQTSSCAH